MILVVLSPQKVFLSPTAILERCLYDPVKEMQWLSPGVFNSSHLSKHYDERSELSRKMIYCRSGNHGNIH